LRPREAAVFAALADSYCAPNRPVGQSDATSFAQELAANSPAINRIGFRVILRVVDLAPVIRRRKRFTALARTQREEFLLGLDRSHWFLLRTAGRLLKTIAMMSYYGDRDVLCELGYDPAANITRGHAFHPKEEPSGARVVDGTNLVRDLEISVDACVIGSGAGGAVTAKELAEAGLSVAMLEEGAYRTPDDYTARPRDMSLALYRDGGQIATVGMPPILLPLGRTLGGTSHINSATCFRTPPPVLELWRERFGLEELTEDEIDPYFRRVEREINVIQTPAEFAGKNAAVVKRGADRLGYSGDWIYRNVRGCIGSGICNFGCPSSAKQHVGVTYVPKAWEAGATTYVNVRAQRIAIDHGRVRAVEAKAASGRRLTVRCGVAVLAAGSIHTPLFLRRQGLDELSGQIGRNLSLHPATGVRALMDERIDMWSGVPQSYFIDEFADEGVMLEGAAGTPDTLAGALPYIGERHRKLMENVRNLSQFGLMVSDSTRGTVRELVGRPHIRYSLNRDDTAKFKRGIEILCEIYWAAGAKRVYPPIASLPELGPEDMDRLRSLDLKRSDLALMAFHPLGTCRMGADASQSPVDPAGRLRGYDGLYITDGSIVPSSLGVNPQITIMALATRIAFGIAGKSAPIDEPHPEHIAQPKVSAAHL
jgi:choline dehydrogenase-like flavoprotein